MTDSRLPENYKIPQNDGGYMKFKQGQNKFRVLGKPIMGWEYFNTDSKPQRYTMDNKPINPTDIKEKGKVKHFRAFPVYNYQDNAIQILELTQSGIMGTLTEYFNNPKRGDPKNYDIIIGRTGESIETEYTVTVDPKEELAKEVAEAYSSMNINLDALYEGQSPFGQPIPF